MIDYVYGYIVLVSSELDRLQEGTNHPRGEDKPVPGRDPITPEVQGQTEPTPKVGPKQNQQDSRQNVTSEMICVTGAGVSRACLVRVQDLVESSCGEFVLFRKGKMCAAWEVPKERGSILDKDLVFLIS